MTAQQIYTKLRLEQRKLNQMPLRSSETLKQSRLVDQLVAKYYRALGGGKRAVG